MMIFFFTDRRCQQRALFFAARLKQTLPMLTTTAWDHVIDRLYTWTYLMHVVPADDPWRWRYVMALEQLVVASPPQLAGIGHENDAPGKESGHLMWTFAVHQVMQLFAIQMSAHHQHQTQATLLHALVSEAKLTPADRDAMYLYHTLRAGFAFDRVWTMQLPDDPHLLAKLEALQSANSNPFEDSACIVVDP
ncbi:hypothetical protein BC940DRAFT_312222 [Gongronella butleri]|nr:hypothetical protein BC940DRAFT_312222 [Gongronella butleri]